ncbi:MAG: ABC transporter ATP-binding protein, partial [Cyclobacteriaceae bacterium]|nr:ABC transporter ATP-binding protein [Cyclobacteriaceae bacterium]
ASRWAYEALAVSQFKNNAYTREFYEEDKQIARSEFKTVYLIPRLQSELEYINIHYKEKENLPDITYRLKTVTNELEKELSYIGRDKFPMIDLLTPETFSYEVFTGTQEFLQNLKSFYNKKAKNAAQEREEKQTKQGKEIDEILAEREQYENEALSLLVKNTATEHRILENRNELVQKIYPIYMDPEFPDHPFDFRSQFYTPKKHIVGLQVDTLYFNTLVIWFMSLMLMVFLYFDWFRKIISGSKGSH